MNGLKRAIARNWKTTASSIVTAGFWFITLNPDRFGGSDSWLVAIAQFAQIGGLLAFGIAAKDYDTTGR